MANHALANSNVHYRNAIFKQDGEYVMGNEDQFDGEFTMNIPVKYVDVGTQNINLNSGDAPLTLAPGNYGDLHMNSGATLITHRWCLQLQPRCCRGRQLQHHLRF